MASETLHERFEDLPAAAIDQHRAIVSLMEELEAVDWYNQRVHATPDDELRAVLAHNRDEEIEHAMMTLEWLRRRTPEIDAAMRMYLFTEGPITELEAKAKAARAGGGGGGGEDACSAPEASSPGSLGVGGLRRAVPPAPAAPQGTRGT